MDNWQFYYEIPKKNYKLTMENRVRLGSGYSHVFTSTRNVLGKLLKRIKSWMH